MDCVQYALARAAKHHGLPPIPDPRDDAAFLAAAARGEDVDWLPGRDQPKPPEGGGMHRV